MTAVHTFRRLRDGRRAKGTAPGGGVSSSTPVAPRSQAQSECHLRLGAAGAVSLVIRSVDDLVALLHQMARDRATLSLARGGKEGR
jgi:hypothetical protein